jgi:hypothetical protein
VAKKHYAYVPGDEPAPKNIVGDISKRNIVPAPRRTDSRFGIWKPSSTLPPAVVDPPDECLLVMFNPQKYLFLTETVTIKEALSDQQERSGWQEAMAKEFNSLTSNNTGTLVPPPGNNKVIGGMWLLGRKTNEFGELLRFKARWVCFGNHQVHMMHYFDTYASVARNESLKLLLSVAVNWSWAVFQFDVKTAKLMLQSMSLRSKGLKNLEKKTGCGS